MVVTGAGEQHMDFTPESLQFKYVWCDNIYSLNIDTYWQYVSISQAPLLGIFKKFPFSDALIPSIFFSLSNPGLQSLTWSRGTPPTGHQSVAGLREQNDRFPSRFLLWVFEIRSGEWAPQLWIGSYFYSSTRWKLFFLQADITFGFFCFGARLIIRIVFFPVWPWG